MRKNIYMLFMSSTSLKKNSFTPKRGYLRLPLHDATKWNQFQQVLM